MEILAGFTGLAVVLLVLGLLWIVLIVIALVQIAQSSALGVPMKLVWVVIVFFFPLLGTIAWFLLGRRIGDLFSR